MSTVFFKINDKQNQEVERMMESEGYSNKAEFFRFLIKFYKYHKSPTDDLAAVLRKLDKKGKLGKPLDEQL